MKVAMDLLDIYYYSAGHSSPTLENQYTTNSTDILQRPITEIN